MYCPGCQQEHLYRTADIYDEKGKLDEGWKFNNDFYEPTFSPSLVINGKIPSERCHFILRDGIIDYFGDCHHELKNTKEPLPDYFPANRFYLHKPI